jgi:hypothetical protein
MKNLSDIIEDCKLNKKPDYEELKYAVLVMAGILNLTNSELIRLYVEGKMPSEFIRNMKLKGGVCTMYRNALNKSPKDYLGWNNDPENPEYQKFHNLGNKLVEKFIKNKTN